MTGLVLEGGTFRPIFSCGVMDALLSEKIMLPYCIGVSAGIADGVSYISRQPQRNLEIVQKYRNDKRYMSRQNFKKCRSLFGLDFIFGEIPNKLIPFDMDTFRKFEGTCLVGVTNATTGQAEYKNAMDMDKAYGDERNPLIEKSEFILSLFEQLVGAGNVSAKEKSILDRCTYDVYREYVANNYEGEPPTLKDLYHSLLKQPEPEARGLALSSELFITGSLNTFAQRTNVDTKARIIAYDIRELGEQLMPIGMLVTLDAIFNRVIQNWKKGKTTWVFADEFYLLFRYEYSADFFYKLWKRIRKYNGLVTGLTQNVEELLRSDTARLMLANSEFLILLNQSATDRDELAGLLHISENQLSYITNVAAGCGLIRCAGNIVPFENSFPRSTRLYQLMTTKPDEALRGV